jgi:hypothetical protein
LTLTFAVHALASSAIPGATFGNGIAGFDICGSSKPPTVVLNHSLLPTETHALLHHFWATGANLLIDRMWVEYYVDGEMSPSVAFQPSMACGQNFPELMTRDYEFAAGGLCGKTAPVGGWWHTFPIPIYKQIVVTVRANEIDGSGCFGAYISLRGTPNIPLAMPGAGWPLPVGTRMRLQKNPTAVRQPLDFVTLAQLEPGEAGMIFQTSWAVQARPRLRTEPLPAAFCASFVRQLGCICNGLAPAKPAPGLGSPCAHAAAHLHRGSAHPLAHLHRDWAHPARICAGTRLVTCL